LPTPFSGFFILSSFFFSTSLFSRDRLSFAVTVAFATLYFVFPVQLSLVPPSSVFPDPVRRSRHSLSSLLPLSRRFLELLSLSVHSFAAANLERAPLPPLSLFPSRSLLVGAKGAYIPRAFPPHRLSLAAMDQFPLLGLRPQRVPARRSSGPRLNPDSGPRYRLLPPPIDFCYGLVLAFPFPHDDHFPPLVPHRSHFFAVQAQNNDLKIPVFCTLPSASDHTLLLILDTRTAIPSTLVLPRTSQ